MTAHPDPTLDDMSPDDLALGDLDDVLAGPEPEWDEEPVAPDADNVDRLLYRLQRLTRDRERDTEQAGLRMLQIEDWLAGRLARHDGQETWLRGALERYHRAVLSLRATAKSLSFPSGTLTSRMGQPDWEVDEEKALAWALPEGAAQRLAAARARYEADVLAVLTDDRVAADAVKVPGPDGPQLSRSGLKRLGTRRDERQRAVAWGVDEHGEPIPGVTVTPAERKFDVTLTGMVDTGDVADWTEEDAR